MAVFEDPVLVLQRLLGPSSLEEAKQDGVHEEGSSMQKPQSLDADIDFNGLSLQEFLSKSNDAISSEPQEQTRSLPVAECEYVFTIASAQWTRLNVTIDEKERSKYEELHRSVIVRHY